MSTDVTSIPEIAGAAPASTLNEREAAITARLRSLADPQARLAWVVNQARQRPPLPDSDRINAHRVSGCQVRLWWVAEQRGDHWSFRVDSDAVSLRALLGLVADIASGATSEELDDWKPVFLEDLGLLRQLAENRRATVLRVLAQMRPNPPAPEPPGSAA